MYYEIYADSMFILQFFMNLYLLAIVNHMLFKAAKGKRLLCGAVLGAFTSLLPFFLPMQFGISTLLSYLLSIMVMSMYTFRVYKGMQLFRVLEKMLIGTLLLGGVLLFLLRLLISTETGSVGLTGVLAMGALCYLLVQYLTRGKEDADNFCKVIFPEGTNEYAVDALIDTGNTLVEPVSKRPVAVIEESIFRKIFAKKDTEYYRVIPYQSVGKKHGLLKGYHMEAVQIEVGGIRKECKNIYVAVSNEILMKDEYKLILNPQILEE